MTFFGNLKHFKLNVKNFDRVKALKIESTFLKSQYKILVSDLTNKSILNNLDFDFSNVDKHVRIIKKHNDINISLFGKSKIPGHFGLLINNVTHKKTGVKGSFIIPFTSLKRGDINTKETFLYNGVILALPKFLKNSSHKHDIISNYKDCFTNTYKGQYIELTTIMKLLFFISFIY